MLGALERDSAAQFYLTHFLELEELAQLGAACRSWKQWLQQAPGFLQASVETHSPAREISLGSAQIVQLSRSHLRNYVINLVTTINPTHAGGAEGDTDSESSACLGPNQALAALLAFSHLRSLTLCLRAQPAADSSLVRDAFLALGPSLTELTVEVSGEHQPPDALLEVVSRHLPLLTQLQRLEVRGWGVRDCAESFSLLGLKRLAYLRSFILRDADVHGLEGALGEGEYITGDYQCTVEQAEQLAQCLALVHVQCGSWTAERNFDDTNEPPWNEEAEVALAADEQRNHIAAFVRTIDLRPNQFASATGSASSAAAAAASSPSPSLSASLLPAPSFCTLSGLPLTSMDLSTTTVCRAVWTHLSRLTCLRRLEPHYWRHGLSEFQWTLLANFKRLTHFRMQPAVAWVDDEAHEQQPGRDDRDAPGQRELKARMEDFLPSLLQCSQLESLRLHGPLLLSTDQLSQMVAAFPRLRVLRLVGVEVESLAPLSGALSLQQLWLICCLDPSGDPSRYRSSIPTLPLLESLRIVEQPRLRAVQLAHLDAQLMQRMPRLHIVNTMPVKSEL